MQKAACGVSIALVAVLVPLLGSPMTARQQRPAAARWITAWGTSQQGLGVNAVTNTTVRMIARVTVSGEAVRIRLDNTFGTAPLTVGRAFVGQRIQGAVLAAGSNRPVLFNASARVIVPPRGSVTSDPVPIQVLAQQDLAVTLYIPDADVRPSQHGGAQVTSYVAASGAGDVAAEETATPFTGTTTSMWWLKAIDVSSPSSTGAIVAFGDSITDGTCSTVDAHDRWEDLLAVRLALDAASQGRRNAHKAVIIGATIIPRHNRPPAENNTGWNAAKTRLRQEVNHWMRTRAPFDAVLDFDAAVKDPHNVDLIAPPFNCGDGIHPSPRGYYEMGTAVRLDLFR
jgi:lysophospholipase L1-like esterase